MFHIDEFKTSFENLTICYWTFYFILFEFFLQSKTQLIKR